MKRVSFKGVAIGNVVDIVASNVVMVPVMIYVLASMKTGSPPDLDAASVAAALKTSNIFLAASTILGGLCSILGGYVSARIASMTKCRTERSRRSSAPALEFIASSTAAAFGCIYCICF
jgi:hypothetical protein